MSFVSDVLPDIDEIRAIPGDLGLRPFTITVRTRSWSGTRVGDGTSTDADAILLVHGQAPKCRRVAYKETAAAGGKYQEGDYRVGPMTPDFPGGGVAFSTLAPTSQASTEIYYRLVGPDTPALGTWCSAVGEEGDHPLHRYLVVRPLGTVL